MLQEDTSPQGRNNKVDFKPIKFENRALARHDNESSCSCAGTYGECDRRSDGTAKRRSQGKPRGSSVVVAIIAWSTSSNGSLFFVRVMEPVGGRTTTSIGCDVLYAAPRDHSFSSEVSTVRRSARIVLLMKTETCVEVSLITSVQGNRVRDA